MGKIILVTGGARSGKSLYAFRKAKERGGKIAFVATCEPRDNEMKKRIALHQAARPQAWTTFEEPCAIDTCLKKIGPAFKTVLIDCLTLWVSNLMLKKTGATAIEKKTRQMAGLFKKIKTDVIIVTNEVGLGIVPGNRLARDFRDIAGRVNQIVAQHATEAYFMVSGIPLRIK